MKIKLDLHVHSEASHDGRMSLDDIVREARARGLDGVAITDHDVTLMSAPEYDDFLVIPGCEFSTEYGHLLGLFLREPIGKLPFAETVEAIHAQGGLAVIAHPFERSRDEKRLEPIVAMLDGVEVQNGRAERRIRDANALAEAFAEAHGMRRFAGSDAHLPCELGNAALCLEAEELTLSAVREALLSGGAEVCEKRRSAALNTARSQYTKLKKTHARPTAYAKWALFAAKCAAEDLFGRY
ncbi:MAG: CehA/McbA family metallohydrolase [Oscillospiraceae bacterium]|nr:CehA/McbA family metallohydrolase [Oscillospiraceae bacterium]